MKIKKPTLIVDLDICRRNIHSMATKAREQGIDFRPHFKTHQSAAIGDLFGDEGTGKIAVSSVDMAAFFVDCGWHDITIAVPVNILEMDEINAVAEKCTLNILVDSIEAAEAVARGIRNFVNVFIKIDCGYHRVGVEGSDLPKINAITAALDQSDKARWVGFLTHTGHNYSAAGRSEILQNHEKMLGMMKTLKECYFPENPFVRVSIGDTPALSITDNFGTADEIRPGNFVFYDAMQLALGSCRPEDIAAFMVCPVISKNEKRREVVIYGGAVHFSKDYFMLSGEKCYGLPFHLAGGIAAGVNDGATWLSGLSQEHGIIKCSDEFFSKAQIGGLVGIFPAHSCLAVDLMRCYYTTAGDKIDIYRNNSY